MFVRGMRIGAFVGAIAIVGLAGCDGEDTAERLVEEAGGGDVDIDVGGLPESFPKDDVPLPGGDIVSGTSVGAANEQTWTVIFDVGDVEDAADDYRGRLEDAGYQIQDTFSGETSPPAQQAPGEIISFIATGDDYLVSMYGGGTGGENVLTIDVSRALTEVP